MSHVATIDIHIKDLESLEKACQSLGLTLNKGKKSYKWFGRSVGDYPLPAGFSKEELGKCEHAISVNGKPGAYEVGVCQRRDGKPGFTLLWDFWKGGYGLEQAIGGGACKLKQYYAAQVSLKVLRRQGMRCELKVQQNGALKIRATN